jgi:hypothetical protein
MKPRIRFSRSTRFASYLSARGQQHTVFLGYDSRSLKNGKLQND